MKYVSIACAAALLLTANAVLRAAGEVGYNKVTVPAASDVVVSIPFVQKSVATLSATGFSAPGLTVAGPLVVDAYKDLFYVRITSGANAGRWATITGNSTNQINLDASIQDILPSLTGASFEIVPHWTLSKAFPQEMKGVSFTESFSTSNRTFDVLLPDTSGLVAINKAPTDTFYFRTPPGNPAAWRRAGSSPTAVFNDTVLAPGSYFVLRNNNVTPVTFVSSGILATNKAQARTLLIQGAKNDLPAASGIAFPVSLYDLKLGGTSAFVASTSSSNRQDDLLVYTNGLSGKNNPPPITYYYRAIAGGPPAWRQVNQDPNGIHDGDIIPAGAAIIIRKSAGTPGTTATWVEPANPY